MDSQTIHKISFSHNENKLCSRKTADYLKDLVIQTISNFFAPKYTLDTKKYNQTLIEIFTNVIVTFQMINLLWYPNMKIKDWDKYWIFWRVTGYSSFDTIIADMKLLKFSFYAFTGALWMCVICIAFVCIFKPYNWKYSKLLIGFPNLIMGFMSTIGYIPALMIFLVTAKYSCFEIDEALVYTYLSKDEIDLGSVGIFLGTSSSLLLAVLSIIYDYFTADLRHSFASKNIKARAYTKIESIFKIYKVILIILYIYVGYDNRIWYLLFIAFSSAALICLCFKFNTYYNILLNIFEIAKKSVLCLCSLIFILGIWLDNSGIIVLLGLLGVPLFLLVSLPKSYEILKINPNKIDINSQYDFELKIRNILLENSPENHKNIIDAFSEVYKLPSIKRNKLLVAWEVNYCLYTLKDIRLAKIKFTKMTYVDSDLEGEIQAWRIKKSIEEAKGSLQAENSLLSYLIDLENTKKDDEELCRYLIDLWCEITSKNPRLGKLENLVDKSTDLIEKIKSTYNQLLLHKNPKAYEYFGTLLQNILNKSELGAEVLSKKCTLYKNNSFSKQRAKFNEECGNMIISANNKDFGSILYINEICAKILKGKINDIIENKINQYIPAPYDQSHNQIMKEYVWSCVSPEVEKPATLFMLDHLGYINECSILVRLAGLNESLYFITSIKPIDSLRQCAIVSEDGYIYSHSSHFPDLLKIKNIKNKYLDSLIPNFNYFLLSYFEPFLINSEGADMALIRCKMQYKNTDIHYALLVYDQKEIENWLNGEANEQKEHFNGLKSPSESLIRAFSTFSIDPHIVNFNSKMSIQENSQESDLNSIENASPSNEDNKEIEEKSLISTPVSSITSNPIYIGKKIIFRSESILKKFKIILFISVKNI